MAASLSEIQKNATATDAPTNLLKIVKEKAVRAGEVLAGGPQDQKYPGADFSGSLRYPSEPGIDANTDYVMFNFYKYIGPFDGRSGGGSNPLRGAIDRYNSTASQYVKSPKNLRQIMLYMPEDISTGYKTNWMGRNFARNTADMMRTAGSGNIFQGLVEGTGGLLKTIDSGPANAMAKFVTDQIQSVTGETISLDDFFGSTRGVIFNPNTELLFQGIDLRSFTLKFKLVPRTAKEATDIESIIYIFKRAMLPSMSVGDEITSGLATISTLGVANASGLGGGATIDKEAHKQLYIQVPDLCQVTFMTGSNKNTHVPQFKMCALSQVDVNYTPDGVYATTSDGRMIAYELSLSFQETKIVFSEEVHDY